MPLNGFYLSDVFDLEKELTMPIANLEAKQDNNPIVIYHKNCADGFSAAWCFYNLARDLTAENGAIYGEAGVTFDFHPGVYGETPPDCTDRVVYLVDFSYKREVVEEIINVAKMVFLIDHHKTAIEDLRCFYDATHPAWEERFLGKFYAYTDLERSGAMLAWDFIHNSAFNQHGHEQGPGDPFYIKPPVLLEHVQDRDLWRFKLDGTRPIQAAVFSYEYTFENWDYLMLGGGDSTPLMNLLNLRRAGEAIERKHFKDIREMIATATRWMVIGDVYMPVLNCPYMWGSDAGHIMATEMADPQAGGGPIGVAAYYYDTNEHRIFGLRSEGSIDVSAIAKLYGGGGHKNAAGFKVPRTHSLVKE